MIATVDTHVRLALLTEEHLEHKMTLNLYLNGGIGATETRVWCATCGRTLRVRGRVPKQGEEVVLGIG